MKQSGLGSHQRRFPAEQLRAGTLRYEISVQGADGYTTFPAALAGFPTNWDFYGTPVAGAHRPARRTDSAVLMPLSIRIRSLPIIAG